MEFCRDGFSSFRSRILQYFLEFPPHATCVRQMLKVFRAELIASGQEFTTSVRNPGRNLTNSEPSHSWTAGLTAFQMDPAKAKGSSGSGVRHRATESLRRNHTILGEGGLYQNRGVEVEPTMRRMPQDVPPPVKIWQMAFGRRVPGH